LIININIGVHQTRSSARSSAHQKSYISDKTSDRAYFKLLEKQEQEGNMQPVRNVGRDVGNVYNSFIKLSIHITSRLYVHITELRNFNMLSLFLFLILSKRS